MTEEQTDTRDETSNEAILTITINKDNGDIKIERTGRKITVFEEIGLYEICKRTVMVDMGIK